MSDRHYLGSVAIKEAALEGPFLPDANVWLFLYGPVQDHRSWQAKAYSAFFAEALKRGAAFYLPQIIATEFVNRSLTLLAETSGWNRKTDGKLHAHKDYPFWAKDACDSLHAFVSDVSRVADRFDEIDLEALYDEVENGGRLDFNDHLIANMCRSLGMTLITHDADFSGMDLPIITANKKLT